MTTSTGEPYQPRPLCSRPEVDPEWWVDLHAGSCSRGCPHGLAAHLCLEHCPLVAECQEMLVHSNSEDYVGMVLGGMMKFRSRHRGPITLQVPDSLYESCEECKVRQRVKV